MPRLAPSLAVALLVPATLLVPAALAAQQPAATTSTSAATAAPAAPPVEQQIAAAVLPLPAAMRAGATVLGYAPGGGTRLDVLRRGSNGMICLADDPALPQFHVACYHDSMEPFMARGRALRRDGVKGDQVDSVRFREVSQGKLALPRQGGMLYQLTGAAYDAASQSIPGARPLFVMYLPFATEASTGLSAVPAPGVPWIMYPGTPKAHIMFTPSMR